jgi:hypothetical protein
MAYKALDAQDAPSGRSNYWGYSPLSFFAPHAGYAMPGCAPLQVLDEFRDMVKALHRAGIEVILDVVYNHSAEGGGTARHRACAGIDNRTYYLLDERGRYADQLGLRQHAQRQPPVVRRSSSTACATGCRRCTSTASASTWPHPRRATRAAAQRQRRRCSGTSTPTRCSPAPS